MSKAQQYINAASDAAEPAQAIAIEIIRELEKEVATGRQIITREVERARVLKDRTDMPLERVQAYELVGKLQEESKRKQFLGYGILDKSNKPVYVVAQELSNVQLQAQLINASPNLTGMEERVPVRVVSLLRAPVRVVPLFWVDQPEEEHF